MSDLLSRLVYRSAGESHGRGITVILEGLPRGLVVDPEAIDAELRRRQGGAGRGGRQRIERDHVDVQAGLRGGATIGSPLAMFVANRDDVLEELPEPTRPRPGHADLAGCYRYLDRDIRGTLERSSARETAGRVAAGGVARQLLARLGCEVFGFVRSVGPATLGERWPGPIAPGDLPGLRAARDETRLYTLDEETDRAMFAEVQAAGADGDTVGGAVEVHAVGVLPGLGSGLQWTERLDARLGAAILSIPAFKGVEIGLGFEGASRRGSQVHDEILPAETAGLRRRSNRAGGLEGGMTNGQDLVVRGAMKPISTLASPLASVDLGSGKAVEAGYERSDVCAVSAASVVAEAMVLLVLADAVLMRLGGETMDEVEERYQRHRERARELGLPPGGGGAPDLP